MTIEPTEKDEKGAAEQWLSLYEKLIILSCTLLATQIAFWCGRLLNDKIATNGEISLLLIGLVINIFAICTVFVL